MNYNNGAGAAMGQTKTADFWPLASVARTWNIPLTTLEEIVRMGALAVQTVGGKRVLPYSRIGARAG